MSKVEEEKTYFSGVLANRYYILKGGAGKGGREEEDNLAPSVSFRSFSSRESGRYRFGSDPRDDGDTSPRRVFLGEK